MCSLCGLETSVGKSCAVAGGFLMTREQHADNSKTKTKQKQTTHAWTSVISLLKHFTEESSRMWAS